LRDGEGEIGRHQLGGYLADGTGVSQSSYVSKDGYWPFYLSLYGGNGSLWSWNSFTNTNGAMMFSRPTRAGSTRPTLQDGPVSNRFHQPAASIVGAAYNSTDTPLLALTNGQIMLRGRQFARHDSPTDSS